MPTTDSLSSQLPGQCRLRTTPCGFPLTHGHSCNPIPPGSWAACAWPALWLCFSGHQELGTQGQHCDSLLWNREFLRMFLQPGFSHLFQKSKAVNSHRQFNCWASRKITYFEKCPFSPILREYQQWPIRKSASPNLRRELPAISIE